MGSPPDLDEVVVRQLETGLELESRLGRRRGECPATTHALGLSVYGKGVSQTQSEALLLFGRSRSLR